MTSSGGAATGAVEVRFAALPAHVRTARLIAAAVARRAGVDEALLYEVRLAVGEACSRAVGLHEQHAPHELVALALACDGGRFVVEVADVGPTDVEQAPVDLRALDPERLAAPAATDPGADGGTGRDPFSELLPAGFGLAVITGLVDDVHITHGPVGSRVLMTWPAVPAADPEPAC